MNEKVKNFVDAFEKELPKFLRLCYMTPGKELQVEASERLTFCKDQIAKIKEEVLADQDDDAVSAAVSLEKIIDVLNYELMMWVALKEDRTSQAWEDLITAQYSLPDALSAHEMASSFENYADHLRALERVLFYPQTFLSAGLVVGSRICSICGQEYDDCDHIKGRLYKGKFCVTELRDVQAGEVSFVNDPASKRHRVLTFTEDGVTKDSLTLRKTP